MAYRCDDQRPYGGQATVYDREYRCYVMDVRFYQDRLRDQRVRGRLLELGVGTGRVAIPLAEAGFHVTGIDRSESMLRQARRRLRSLAPETAARLRFRKGDLASFRLAERFDGVLAPFSALNLVVDPADRAACLARCHDHLRPGGFLWVDAPIPPPPGPDGTLPKRRFTVTIPLSRYGRLMVKETTERPDVAAGVDWITYGYREVRACDGAVLRAYDVVFPMARLAPDEVVRSVEAAGFDVLERFGDYLGTPFGPGADRLVIEAVRR